MFQRRHSDSRDALAQRSLKPGWFAAFGTYQASPWPARATGRLNGRIHPPRGTTLSLSILGPRRLHIVGATTDPPTLMSIERSVREPALPRQATAPPTAHCLGTTRDAEASGEMKSAFCHADSARRHPSRLVSDLPTREHLRAHPSHHRVSTKPRPDHSVRRALWRTSFRADPAIPDALRTGRTAALQDRSARSATRRREPWSSRLGG